MSAEFLDTNVLLYTVDTNDTRKHLRARELIVPLILSGKAAVSIQVLTEFYGVATRKMRLAPAEVCEMLADFDTCLLHAPSRSDLFRASQVQQKHQISWWDALIINSAQQLNASILWTEDLNHNQRYDNLIVKNPFLDS